MRILITGCTGFIGSHLAKGLKEKGKHDLFGIVTPFQLTEELYRKMLEGVVEPISADLTDKFGIDRAVRQADPEVVFHLGAQTSVPQSWRNPILFADVNYAGTIRLLKSSQQFAPNLEKFVNVVTGECLRSRPEPHDEVNLEYGWDSPYGVSKVAAEFYGYLAYLANGLPVITVRPNNAVHRKTSKNFLVETIVTQMLEGNRLTLRGHTHQRRNWTLIDDVVDGFIQVMERGRIGQLYHLAFKESALSIGEVIETAKKVLNWEGEVITGTAPRPYDPESLVLDTIRSEEIGWRLKHSVEDIIRILAEYWRDRT